MVEDFMIIITAILTIVLIVLLARDNPELNEIRTFEKIERQQYIISFLLFTSIIVDLILKYYPK